MLRYNTRMFAFYSKLPNHLAAYVPISFQMNPYAAGCLQIWSGRRKPGTTVANSRSSIIRVHIKLKKSKYKTALVPNSIDVIFWPVLSTIFGFFLVPWVSDYIIFWFLKVIRGLCQSLDQTGRQASPIWFSVAIISDFYRIRRTVLRFFWYVSVIRFSKIIPEMDEFNRYRIFPGSTYPENWTGSMEKYSIVRLVDIFWNESVHLLQLSKN